MVDYAVGFEGLLPVDLVSCSKKINFDFIRVQFYFNFNL